MLLETSHLLHLSSHPPCSLRIILRGANCPLSLRGKSRTVKKRMRLCFHFYWFIDSSIYWAWSFAYCTDTFFGWKCPWDAVKCRKISLKRQNNYPKRTCSKICFSSRVWASRREGGREGASYQLSVCTVECEYSPELVQCNFCLV